MSIYNTNSCTTWTGTLSDGACIERTNVQSLDSQDVKDIGVEIGGVVSVFVIAMMFVMFLLQYLLYAIMPKRGAKTMRY